MEWYPIRFQKSLFSFYFHSKCFNTPNCLCFVSLHCSLNFTLFLTNVVNVLTIIHWMSSVLKWSETAVFQNISNFDRREAELGEPLMQTPVSKTSWLTWLITLSSQCPNIVVTGMVVIKLSWRTTCRLQGGDWFLVLISR